MWLVTSNNTTHTHTHAHARAFYHLHSLAGNSSASIYKDASECVCHCMWEHALPSETDRNNEEVAILRERSMLPKSRSCQHKIGLVHVD